MTRTPQVPGRPGRWLAGWLCSGRADLRCRRSGNPCSASGPYQGEAMALVLRYRARLADNRPIRPRFREFIVHSDRRSPTRSAGVTVFPGSRAGDRPAACQARRSRRGSERRGWLEVSRLYPVAGQVGEQGVVRLPAVGPAPSADADIPIQ